MKTIFRTLSKNTALFAPMIIALIALANLGFIQSAWGAANGITKTILLVNVAGKSFKVTIDPTGKFTSPILSKGMYIFSVRTTQSNAPAIKTDPSSASSTANKISRVDAEQSTTSHVTFVKTGGVMIMVGGQAATGKITLTGDQTINVDVGKSGTVLTGTIN